MKKRNEELASVGVLSPSHPDVLMTFRRRSPADSAAGHSAPPGSHSAPPVLKIYRKRWEPCLIPPALLPKSGVRRARRALEWGYFYSAGPPLQTASPPW